MTHESLADLRTKREQTRQHIQQLEKEYGGKREGLQTQLDTLDRQIDAEVNRLLQKVRATTDAWVDYVELAQFANEHGYNHHVITRAWGALIGDQLAEIAAANIPGLEAVREADRIGYHYFCQVLPYVTTERLSNFGAKSAELVREWARSL